VNINELNIAVNDLKGKYVKPTLKKVSKYENKFAKLQKKVNSEREEQNISGFSGSRIQLP
jgi:hypothetical protein